MKLFQETLAGDSRQRGGMHIPSLAGSKDHRVCVHLGPFVWAIAVGGKTAFFVVVVGFGDNVQDGRVG